MRSNWVISPNRGLRAAARHREARDAAQARGQTQAPVTCCFPHSDLLSKREFAVLYAGLQADKATAGMQGMATNIMAALGALGCVRGRVGRGPGNE